MIYAIVPFQDSNPDGVFSELKKFEIPIYDAEAPNIYFVSWTESSTKLRHLIGWNEENQNGEGIILAVSEYTGYGRLDLHEWIERYKV